MPPRFPDAPIVRIDLREPSASCAFNPLTGTTHAPGSEDATGARPTVRELYDALQLVFRYSQFIETVTLLSGQ